MSHDGTAGVTHLRRRRVSPRVVGLVLTASVGLAGCSLSSGDQTGTTTAARTVVVATHDSWAMPKRVLAQFTAKTGYRVRVEPNGDAGALTNKLVLTKGAPIADMTYGIDNTFASRAVDAGILAAYSPPHVPASVSRFVLSGAAGRRLTPVDYGDVCVNVDDAWFRRHHLAAPSGFADLVRPAYRGLFVTPGATTSSPGLAFLLATIARYGDRWPSYWRQLMANGARITSGWSDAWGVDYTAGGGHGDRPIVLSYASSIPDTIPEGASRPTTHALLDTCFRQVEFAGVLAGASNPEGARAFIDFMQGRAFQRALPDAMYVYPVVAGTPLPATWSRYARTASHPWRVAPARITAERSTWSRQWGEVTSR